MSGTGQLPISTDSQNIGARADKCFGARCPENWRPHNVGGTDDFGIDYQVQTIENNQATDMFRVQLKGTTVPVLNADGTLFSMPLKTSTVRYYARFTEPILLVICDLSVSARAIDCPLYFVWIHAELKRVDTRGLLDDQVSVTLHVPKSNVLNEDTNLSQDLEQFRALAKIGGSLNVTLESQNPSLDASSRLSLLEKLPRGFAERSPALIESLAEEPTSAWPTRPVNSMPWYLSEIDRYLVSADFERAKEMLVQAEKQLPSAKSLEIGEYWHLTGRLHLLNLDQPEACKAFKLAADAAPTNAKHLAAWGEIEMAVRFCIDGPNNFDDIYPLLTSSAPEIRAVKARLFAAERRDDEAEEVLDSFTGPEQLSTKAVFRTMRARWQDAIDVCDQGLALSNVKQTTRLLFIILKAKSQFHLAVDDDDSPSGHVRLPLTGRPGSDLSLLSTAWDGMTAAMDGLRSAGWPTNTEFIADIVAAAASILQKEEEALNLLVVASEKRTDMPVLQASVESLAAQTRKYDVALAANLRQPANPTTKLRRAFLLHMMKRDNDCISFFEANLNGFDADDPMYAETLTAAIVSADRLVRADLIKKWAPLFDATPNLIVHRAIMDYALDVTKKPKVEALSTLYERFIEHERPVGIAIQLFYDFNAQKSDDAERIIALAAQLDKHRLLPLDGVIQLSQAYATLDKWSDLLSLMQKERGRFSANQTLVAIESLALDRLGRTAEARNLLAPLVSNGATDQFVLGTHVDIMIRCGFIEEAIQTTEIMVAAEKDISKKRDHLRVLHNLVRANNPSDLRAHDIAWRMGKFTDPMDEIDEGVFLMTIAISPYPGDPDPEQVEEYQRRLNDYTTRFPQSKVMRSATVPENPTPDELLASLMALMGDTVESLENKQVEREKLKQQGGHAPFSWRPKYFFSEIQDLPQLWELSKEAKGTDFKFVLSMFLDTWTARPWSSMADRVPLLDMVALLVTYDLGILDKIFELFPKVAIPQRTMFYLGRLSDPFAGSLQIEKCRAIQQVLQKNFELLLQPRATNMNAEGRNVESFQITHELKNLAAQPPYLLYSDDAITQVYCKGHENTVESICTLDILSAMEKNGVLTASEVAQKVGMLCSWGVRVSVEPGWQIGSLPESLANSQSVAEGVVTIRNADLCIAVFNGLWEGGDLRFIDFMNHASMLINLMLYQHKMGTMAVASLMGIWLDKASVRPDAPPDRLVIPALLFQTAATHAMYANPYENRSGLLWHVYFLLLEYAEGGKLKSESISNAVENMAAAAANHDLYIRKLFDPSLRSFLVSSLIDSSRTKHEFINFYWQFRMFLLADLNISTTMPKSLPLQTGQALGWQLWVRSQIAEVPSERENNDISGILRFRLSSEGESGTGLYRQKWRQLEPWNITLRWHLLSKTRKP